MFSMTASRGAALALATLLPATPTLASQDEALRAQEAATAAVQRDSGTERIDYAGKLRMLSQRMSASACNNAAGIGGWESHGYLQASVGEFNRIMNALEFGDVFISVRSPERDRTVLNRINEMNAVWEPVSQEMLGMIRGQDQSDKVEYALNAAPELLDITQRLVGDIMGQYADPVDMLASDAIMLDIIGRQRMMPQIISKNACMVADGIQSASAREELVETIETYTLALNALQNGMPELGVKRPPNEAIAASLSDINDRWQSVRPLLDGLLAGETLTTQDRETIYSVMNTLTADMNTVSAGYAKVSKQNL